MEKLCFLLLLIPFISLSQTTYYKYAPRQETSQVNYAKVGQDINNTLNNVLEQREAKARALGWSSAAEMDAARKEEKRRIKREKALEKEMKRAKKREEKEKVLEKEQKIN